MSAWDRRILRLYEAETSGAVVRFRTVSESERRQWGYVVGVGAMFVLFHIVETDTMRLNGYTALPLTEIYRARPVEDTFVHRALAMKEMGAVPQPDILLLDFPGLLSSANALFPLVTVHPERKWPGTCHIGRVERVTDKAVTLQEIDPQARWAGPGTYRFKDITRVDFGGGYEEALWRLSEPAGRAAAPEE
jgi:hypothetical protein